MRILKITITVCLCLSTTILFAAPPTVHYNLPVMQNASPAQCNDWRGQIGPEENSTSRMTPMSGLSNFGSPGIRTCTGCAITQNSTCVCKTCYDYTDNL